MGELYEGVDTGALLLRGVTAATSDGEDVTHLIEIYDDGGFEQYVAENFVGITPSGDDGTDIGAPGGIGGGIGALPWLPGSVFNVYADIYAQ